MRIFLILLLTIGVSFANTTQNNTSGSNTSITGGYTSSATNTYQSGSSNNTTTTNNSTSNIKSAPPTASAPSVTNSGSDVCLAGASLVFKLLVLVFLEVNHLEIKIVKESNYQEN